MALVRVAAGLIAFVTIGSEAPGIVTGGAAWHQVGEGQSVVSIAARVGLEPATLAADNGLRADRPLSAGSWILVDNRHIVPTGLAGGIVVNVPQRMLHVARDGVHMLSVPIAVGRPDWPTPLGEFAIAAKEVDPTWDVPVSIQEEMERLGKPVLQKVAPGPQNPLGERWMGLTAPGVGIHGTNQPTSVYRFTTHGCIRLHPDDAVRVFDLVQVGTPVRVVYEAVLLAEFATGDVWLEVHRDPYRRTGSRLLAARRLLEAAGLSDLTTSPVVAEVAKAERGRAERVR